MFSLRPQQQTDRALLIELSKRAWAEVERSIDSVLGSPLDRLVTPSWSAHHEAVVRDACDSPETSVVVAENATEAIVGFVAYLIHPVTPAMSAYGEITAIAVDPQSQSLGIGRRLLDCAVSDLRSAGAPVIMLSTGGDEGHTPARALYEAAGFTRLPLTQYWLAGDDQPSS